jgi:uncharacterized protein (TIGR00255 family)
MAIESMTGFALCQTAGPGGARISCEIRSVNGKSLDARLRLPAGLERLETQVRQIVQAKIARGNLQLTVTQEEGEAASSLHINNALVGEILALSSALRDRHGLAMPTIGELLSMRGVLDNAASDEAPDLDGPVLQAVSAACDELKAFRAREGAALKALLLAHMSQIEQLASTAASDASRTPEAIRERLAGQVRLLMDSVQGFDEQRLTMEAALLAAKADIREEIDRLTAHIAVARALLAGGGPVGRKLDFLAQEFNREANTLCSKSNASTVTAIGLDLKAVVDQFREQVQNLE